MNLQDVWKKLEVEKLEVARPSPLNPWAIKSKHPVAKLKEAYKITTLFSVVFLIGFIVLFFLFDQMLVKLGLAATIVGYIFFFVTNFNMYRKIKAEFPVESDLKSVLTHTYTFITSNIRFQERTALFIYPIAGAAGFLMGGASAGADPEAFIQKPVVVAILVVFLIIATPLCWLLARWLYRISYGVCLAQLKELIDELEKPLPATNLPG
ncbi:MAG: hypothetical protein JNL17_09340 [Cyclobacteriaceae bacterium]|nr:hypothetical protein [Cyclobacteriaceae bacterium]